MNHAITMPHAFHVPRSNRRRPVLGWGISLLVHACAIAWIWQATAPRPDDVEARPAKAFVMRLQPVSADVPLPAAATRSLPAPTPPSRRPASASRQAPASAAPAIIAMPPEPTAPAAGGATAETPTFDLAAARATARLVTREEKKGLVALPARQPVDELRADTRTSERLERARRGNCLKGQEGTNLLANVAFLARDIVKSAVDDSGCKW